MDPSVVTDIVIALALISIWYLLYCINKYLHFLVTKDWRQDFQQELNIYLDEALLQKDMEEKSKLDGRLQ